MFRGLPTYLRKFDWLLFGACLLLVACGLAVLYSTSLGSGGSFSESGSMFGGSRISNAAPDDFSNFWKQVAFALGGGLIIFILPAFNYRVLSSLAKALYAISILLLVAVLVFGKSVRGTTGWFNVAGFGIQPVEIVKFFLICFLAKFFSEYARDSRRFLPIIGSGLAFVGLFLIVLMQPDFGSAFVLLAIWGVMLLMSGVRRSHLLAAAAIFIVAAAIGWAFALKPYQKDRLTSFLDPGRDPRGRGYNVTQSVIAIGSGGWIGRGLGSGPQSQLRFLPERQTDFIFAVLAEELGFFGVVLVCGLFGVIFYRAYVLAKDARDDFTLFIIVGISASVAVEMFINLGGNLRVIPVTGITLPFVSYGGSSLIAKMIMIGVLESIAVRR